MITVVSILISAAALLLSVVGILYGWAYWKGKTDNELGWLKQKIQSFGEARVLDRLTRMETKFEVVWDIFAEQMLTNRPNLATRSSPFKPTEQSQKAISEVKSCLDSKLNSRLTDHVLVDIPQQIGMAKLRKIAESHDMTLGELLALISIELGDSECE